MLPTANNEMLDETDPSAMTRQEKFYILLNIQLIAPFLSHSSAVCVRLQGICAETRGFGDTSVRYRGRVNAPSR
jgi:hypothetical protein